jgi:uncharacterized protein (TIGR03435 family)
MKFLVRVLSPLLIFVSWVNVVTSQGELTFEVVSIKENRGTSLGSSSITPQSLAFLSITPSGLIRWAYDLQQREVVGGPEWINTVRFTVRATTTRDARVPEFREMVKNVLRTRFQMDAVFETQQDQPIYRLIRAHADGRLGPGMAPAPFECKRDGVISVSDEPRPMGSQNCSLGFFMGGGGALTAVAGNNATMSELARTLSGRKEFDRPVFDFTGLEGEYNFFVQVSNRGPDAASADPVANSAAWFSALTEQLGLRLQASRGPVRVLRVRSIERPTAD